MKQKQVYLHSFKTWKTPSQKRQQLHKDPTPTAAQSPFIVTRSCDPAILPIASYHPRNSPADNENIISYSLCSMCKTPLKKKKQGIEPNRHRLICIPLPLTPYHINAHQTLETPPRPPSHPSSQQKKRTRPQSTKPDDNNNNGTRISL